MRILLAENNELMGVLIQSVLNGAGYNTDLVVDGIKVFEKLNSVTYDLIVSEILLPYYTGLEVLYFLNKLSNRPRAIILSSVQNMNTVHQAYHLNVDLYITKPFDPDRLPQEIEKIGVI